MHNVIIGLVTGGIAGLSRIIADAATGASHDMAGVLAIVVPICGFSWYLSARLTKIEDAVKNLDCMQCPKNKKEKDPL